MVNTKMNPCPLCGMKLKQADDLLEEAVEEIENMYGRETDLTEKIRLFIDKEREQ